MDPSGFAFGRMQRLVSVGRKRSATGREISATGSSSVMRPGCKESPRRADAPGQKTGELLQVSTTFQASAGTETGGARVQPAVDLTKMGGSGGHNGIIVIDTRFRAFRLEGNLGRRARRIERRTPKGRCDAKHSHSECWLRCRDGNCISGRHRTQRWSQTAGI